MKYVRKMLTQHKLLSPRIFFNQPLSLHRGSIIGVCMFVCIHWKGRNIRSAQTLFVGTNEYKTKSQVCLNMKTTLRKPYKINVPLKLGLTDQHRRPTEMDGVSAGANKWKFISTGEKNHPNHSVCLG